MESNITIKRKVGGGGNISNPTQLGTIYEVPGAQNGGVQIMPVRNTKYLTDMEKDVIMPEEELKANTGFFATFKSKPVIQEPKIDYILSPLLPFVPFNSTAPESATLLASLKCDEFDYEKANLGVDLICVIDQSGSMEGEKNELVQKTLNHLISILTEKDRLSIVTFENRASCKCGFNRCGTPEEKSKLKKEVDGLKPSGGTEIIRGLAMASKLIKERKKVNDVTSIFLLSDGQDNSASSYIDYFVEDFKLADIPLTIMSFGYGVENDTKLMERISSVKNGSFYFIDSIETIGRCFMDALGALKSSVYQDIEMKFELRNPKKEYKIKFSKNFGKQWKVIREQACSLKFEQMRAGSSKDFIFQLEIPADRDIHPSEFIITSEVTFRSIISNKAIKMNQDCFIKIHSIYDFEQLNFNLHVLEQLTRVEGAEAMERALLSLDQGNPEEGLRIIESVRANIEARPDSDEFGGTKKRMIQGLDAAAGTLKKKYKNDAAVGLIREMGAAHMNQNSTANVDAYQNGTQKRIIQKVKK